MPNYNGIRYLQQAIDSFISQEYQAKELIIVDGKSVDGSHDLIGEYEKRNINIKWVKDKDSCVTDGFNIGLKYTNGNIIGFLSSDSIYYSNDVFDTIASNYGKIKFDSIYFDAYSHFVKENSILLRSCNYTFTRDTFLKVGCFLPFENVFFNSRIYEKYQLDINFNMSSDIEFYMRILNENLLSLYINKVSTINIYDGSNLSVVHAEKQQREWRKVDIKFLIDNITEKDFALHESIVKSDYKISVDFIRKAEAWLRTLFQYNYEKKIYSEEVFRNRFIPYWNDIIISSQKLGIRSYFLTMRSPLTAQLNFSRVKKVKILLHSLATPLFNK